jgi:uncharacterized membrane protein HdeD (DUF308 family)
MIMTTDLRRDLHRAASWVMAFSVLMIAAGLLAIALPLVAGAAVTALVGWLLTFSGILHLALAWRGGAGPTAIILEMLLGFVYGAIGVYILLYPLIGLESLTLAIAIYLFLEGALESIFSYQLRSESGAGWLLLNGIVTLALAIWISATWPASSAWVIGTIVGISMLFSGVSRLMFWNAARRMMAW